MCVGGRSGMGVRGGNSVVTFYIYLFFCVSKAFAPVLVKSYFLPLNPITTGLFEGF